MKKLISMFLAFAICFALFSGFAASAYAAETAPEVRLNGQIVKFPDTAPYINSESRTMIPVRAVSEQLGADVEWLAETNTAKISMDGITVSVKIGDSVIKVEENSESRNVTMDTTAVITGGRTCVPIRFVMEALGAFVDYSDMFNTVQIYKDLLSAAEIARLRSYYDRNIEDEYAREGLKPVGSYENSIKLSPQLANFAGSGNPYGFSNANEWKIRNKQERGYGPFEGAFCKQKYDAATDDDFKYTKLIMDEAVMTVVFFLKEDNLVGFNFRTDLSSIISPRSGALATIVRGVCTVEIPSNAGYQTLNAISEVYTIKNPVPGQFYDIDLQITVQSDWQTHMIYSTLMEVLGVA